MTRHNKSFRTNQRGQSKSKSQNGGNQGSYPDSGWGFQLNNVGDAWSQFTRVMGSSSTSNVITPANSAAPVSPAPVPPASAQKGGKRRVKKTKKGGYWGAVIEQAVVPLTLLGMQQKFGTRRNRNVARNKSFRRRH